MASRDDQGPSDSNDRDEHHVDRSNWNHNDPNDSNDGRDDDDLSPSASAASATAIHARTATPQLVHTAHDHAAIGSAKRDYDDTFSDAARQANDEDRTSGGRGGPANGPMGDKGVRVPGSLDVEDSVCKRSAQDGVGGGELRAPAPAPARAAAEASALTAHAPAPAPAPDPARAAPAVHVPVPAAPAVHVPVPAALAAAVAPASAALAAAVPQGPYFCDICHVSCSGPESYAAHMVGQPHAKMVARQHGLIGNLRCDVCNITVTCHVTLQSHLAGSAHAKELRKQVRL